MRSISLTFMIVVLFNYFINVYAKNDHYIVSIMSNLNHKNYDDESQSVQEAIDVLVNDRLNDIYNIIEENKDSYLLENGQMDEKLEELDLIALKKRNNETTKFIFVSQNRPKNITTFQKIYKRTDNLEEINYIPIKSKLARPLCPVGNDYAVVIYASEKVIKKIKKLPNIRRCTKNNPLKQLYNNDNDNNNTYYNLEYIKKETNWTDISIQDRFSYVKERYFYSHLSLMSQSRFDMESTEEYDNNYYYPSSAGQDIDIYVIDTAVNFNNDEFDTYNESRTITCDVIIENDNFYEIPDDDVINRKECGVKDKGIESHGTLVSMAAGGKYTGAAKKSNLHFIAATLDTFDEILGFDYIKLNAVPYKTVINLSIGGNGDSPEMAAKFIELKEAGFIIFVSAGNNNVDCCSKEYYFGGYDGVITVGATESTFYNDINNGYSRSSYSNFGPCVDIFAPGEILYPSLDQYSRVSREGVRFQTSIGTSFASPLVAGVAATIMSEHSEIHYDHYSMKQILIDMSIKDILKGINDETPNRFINNGKRIVYSPTNTYRGCGETSGNSKCSKGCCTKNNKCIEFDGRNMSQYCSISKGCQSEFSEFCLSSLNTKVSTRKTNKRCGPEYGSCITKNSRYYDDVECCSSDGYCGRSSEYCGKGCQSEFGVCYLSN
ncbi:subtilisin-like protein [Anaeromyces robustus]|uniref:Subtilisin-like protein n=1 Tax=Anaeromyces robustus TaxID=1754192 RepID=A0A1Y1X087_9FUNG|nr:subtilisin-like protein [Anaeromyces robustus]|eukprot:ORX79055.1 subtilisin-like protein [Anaeromyces robustus]